MSHSSNSPEPRQLNDRYAKYALEPLSYGTVRDYCDSVDHLFPLATTNRDLKDCQRPWALKAVLATHQSPANLLEIGAGEPLVANLLQQVGHKVWIADPYDGSGNGPTAYEEYRRGYPNLNFIRSDFGETLAGVVERSFDCIYSISVLEHVPDRALKGIFDNLRRFLKPGGKTIHAIDHVHRGQGAAWHLAHLRRLIGGFGFEDRDLDAVLASLTEDPETYYLSAEGHNRWRGELPYNKFPMRVCVSVQVVAEASQLAAVE